MINYNINVENEEEVKELYKLLKKNTNYEKVNWTTHILNTKKEVLAIKSVELKEIAKKIYKTNYTAYLEIMPDYCHELLMIDAYVISLIKDFKTKKKYIDKLIPYIDNWAICDSIKFNIKGYEQEFLDYSVYLVNSKNNFARRIGVRILFSYIGIPMYVPKVFEIIKNLELEEDYYVNMAVAWLLCESVIKNKEYTLDYLKNNKVNSFVLNKTISKCRDSFRVSKEDKNTLNKIKDKEVSKK